MFWLVSILKTFSLLIFGLFMQFPYFLREISSTSRQGQIMRYLIFQFQFSHIVHEGSIMSCRVHVYYAIEIWSSVRKLVKSYISYTPFDTGSEKVIELQTCCHSGTKGEVIHLMQTKSWSCQFWGKEVLGRGFNRALQSK